MRQVTLITPHRTSVQPDRRHHAADAAVAVGDCVQALLSVALRCRRRRVLWCKTEAGGTLDSASAAMQALTGTHAVVINGARQVGKSTPVQAIVRQTAGAGESHLDQAAVRAAARQDPDGVVIMTDFFSSMQAPSV
ncbi:hypothetical protein ACWCSD_00605 [Nonomuraea sp. NPDC001684]